MISRIIKVEVGVIGWGWQPLLRPWLFWISQKPNLIILFYYTLNKSFLSRFNIKCFQSLCQLFLFLKFSQFFLFHVISKQLLRHRRRPLCVCESLSSTTFSMSYSVNEANLEVMFLLLHALTASNTKRPDLTWLAFNRNHAPQSYITWLPVTLSWVSSTWLLYNLQLDDVPGADFENSLYTFSKSEKRYWSSWMYSNNP